MVIDYSEHLEGWKLCAKIKSKQEREKKKSQSCLVHVSSNWSQLAKKNVVVLLSLSNLDFGAHLEKLWLNSFNNGGVSVVMIWYEQRHSNVKK